MNLKKRKTDRGFTVIEFSDRYDKECNIQESSLATENAIWFGVANVEPKVLVKGEGWVDTKISDDILISTRMHLTQEDVKNLLPILQEFAETGKLKMKK